MDYIFLSSTPLFKGATPSEIESMLSCLKTRQISCCKGDLIFRIGDVINEVGIVLSGGVSIENDDLWGNKTILDYVGRGQLFAETYACVQGEPMMVNVVASENSEILLLNVKEILQVCSNTCVYHGKLISNLLAISAQKNLNLSRRSFHTAPRSIRGRLLSYLSYQAISQGKHDFYIPFNRQQLADYLNVDRSALSNELSKMQKDGVLKTEKNHFLLSEQLTEEI